MFLHQAKQIMRKYLLLSPCIPEKFSSNYVQMLSSMHSNVQLLYLLLFFAVVGGVAVLLAKGSY